MTVLVRIEDVFTVQPNRSAPNGGHTCLVRPTELPEVGQVLVQGEQEWPIIGVETFPVGCFVNDGRNVGILVPRELPKPGLGAARIKAVPIDIIVRCAICTEPMEVEDPGDGCSKHCPDGAHIHVRCAGCNPSQKFVVYLPAEAKA